MLHIGLEWKPQDLWIGVFWKRSTEIEDHGKWAQVTPRVDLWICLVPCLPIHVWWHQQTDIQVWPRK